MPDLSEKDLQQRIVQAAGLYGWRVAHFRPARTAQGWRTPMQGDVGVPDLVLGRRGVVILAELKSERARFGYCYVCRASAGDACRDRGRQRRRRHGRREWRYAVDRTAERSQLSLPYILWVLVGVPLVASTPAWIAIWLMETR